MKKAAFILDHNLKHYRIPFFESLSDVFKITIIHKGPIIEGEFNFEQNIVPSQSFGPFIYYQIPHIKEYDTIVIMQNLRVINLFSITLNPLIKAKILHWGIGVSSTGGLQKHNNLLSRIRNWISNKADGIAFYSSYPLPFYSKENQEKSLVVGNSIKNSETEDLSNSEKDSFMFIGSLHKRKGLDLLIKAFKSYLQQGVQNIDQLYIVGDGEEREELEYLAKSLDLTDCIQFVGNETSSVKKKSYFKRSIACISPNQAGLSVLESFSYGVPFITKINPISGGEYLNIIENETGCFFDGSVEDLTRVMIRFSKDEEYAKKLGGNAFQHYQTKMNMDTMVTNFKTLINKTKQ